MLKALLAGCAAIALISGSAVAQTTPSPGTTTPGTTTPGTTTGTGGAGGGAAGTKSRSECETMFKSADRNGDGRLDQAEMSGAKASMPATLATATSATQQEYMKACSGS